MGGFLSKSRRLFAVAVCAVLFSVNGPSISPAAGAAAAPAVVTDFKEDPQGGPAAVADKPAGDAPAAARVGVKAKPPAAWNPELLVEAPAVTPPTAGAYVFDGSAASSAKAADAGLTVDASAKGTVAANPVTVTVLDQATLSRFGGQMLGFTVEAKDPTAAVTDVPMTIDYAKYAKAYGADWASRLRLVQFPACVLTTPDDPACTTPVAVDGVNDPLTSRLQVTLAPTKQDTAMVPDTATEPATPDANTPTTAPATSDTSAAVQDPTTTVPPATDPATDNTKTPATGNESTTPAAATDTTATDATATDATATDASTSTVAPDGSGAKAAAPAAGVAAPLLGGGGAVFALLAGNGSSAGDFKATSLSASGKWSVSGNSGGFGWQYPIPVPPATVGPAPALALSYSSQSVDGLTGSENTQGGPIGLGWSLSGLGSIERRYVSCGDDGNTGSTQASELCWKSDNATLSLNGVSSELVRDDTTGEWHLKDWSDWKIQKLAGVSNGDNDGEYWRVTTPDGVRYYFGLGYGVDAVSSPTNSVFTVPVVGNNTGEPCKAATFAASVCTQAYRWNLDRVETPRDTAMGIFYTQEIGQYGQFGASTPVNYVRDGFASLIRYSAEEDGFDNVSPTWVDLAYGERCLDNVNSSGACPPLTPANAGQWPDVPVDLVCGATCGAGQHTPVFFSTRRLASVKTYTRDGAGIVRTVDLFDLNQSYPGVFGGGDDKMWFSSLVRTGAPSSSITVVSPKVKFNGVLLDNRADTITYNMYRVNAIIDEVGGETDINYGLTKPCPDPMPTNWLPNASGWDQNDYDCFPVYFVPDSGSPGFAVHNKWLVQSVVAKDRVGGSPDQTYIYSYSSDTSSYALPAGSTQVPHWHHANDPITKSTLQTFGEWRGYPKVTVTVQGSSTYNTADQVTESRYFLGMNGDKKNAGGTWSGRQVKASNTAVTSDDDWMAGRVLETRNLSGTTELKAQVHTYNAPVTKATMTTSQNGPRVARLVTEKQLDSRTKNGAAVINTRTKTFYDSEGFPTAVRDQGDTATTADDTCTWYQYTRSSTATGSGYWWMRDRVARQRVYDDTTNAAAATDCNTVSGTILKQVANFYDAHATPDDPPLKGENTGVHTNTGTTTIATHTSYDAWGRVASITDANGNISTTSYTPSDEALTTSVTATNPRGMATTTSFDRRRGLVTQSTDPNARSTVSNFDGLGRTLDVTLPTETTGHSYEFIYGWTVDANSIINSPVSVVTSQLQSSGVWLSTWSYYDGLARLRESQVLSPNTSTTQTIVTATRYNDVGSARSQTEVFTVGGVPYDGMANAPDTDVVQIDFYGYDALGRVTQTARRHGDGTTLTTLRSTSTAYTGFSQSDTNPMGIVTDTNRDLRGKTVQIVQHAASGNINTNFAYDLVGNQTRIADNAGNRTNKTYDMLGRVLTVNSRDQGQWTSTYDANGNVTQASDGDGGTTGVLTPDIFTNYDELNRPTSRREANPTSGLLLADWDYYDDPGQPTNTYKGQLQQAISYDGPVTYTNTVASYDGRYRPIVTAAVVAGAGAGLDGSYPNITGYDAANHPTSSYLPPVGGLLGETLNTTYSTLGRAKSMSGTNSNNFTRSYISDTNWWAVGFVNERYYGQTGDAQVKRQISYGGLSRWLASTTAQTGTGWTTTIQDDTFAYDNNHNVLYMNDAVNANQKQCFIYDSIDRINKAWTTTPGATCNSTDFATPGTTGADRYKQQFTIDTLGRINAIANTNSSGVTTTTAYTYNPDGAFSDQPHAAQTIGGVTYTYDDNGQTKQNGATTYQWTSQHKLEKVTNAGGSVENWYDADGNRILRQAANGTKTLYLPGQEVTLTGTTVTATRYYGFAGTSVAIRSATSLKWVINNQQASTSVTLDAVTATVERQRNMPFGAQRGTGTFTNTDHGFLGKPKDADSGLNQLGARFYDATTARFLSPDPLTGANGPISLDPYQYGNDNPTTYSDPTGLCSYKGYGSGEPCGGSSGSNGSQAGGRSNVTTTVTENTSYLSGPPKGCSIAATGLCTYSWSLVAGEGARKSANLAPDAIDVWDALTVSGSVVYTCQPSCRSVTRITTTMINGRTVLARDILQSNMVVFDTADHDLNKRSGPKDADGNVGDADLRACAEKCTSEIFKLAASVTGEFRTAIKVEASITTTICWGFCIAVSQDGALGFGVGTPGVSWTAPSHAPEGPSISGSLCVVIWCGGSTWSENGFSGDQGPGFGPPGGSIIFGGL